MSVDWIHRSERPLDEGPAHLCSKSLGSKENNKAEPCQWTLTTFEASMLIMILVILPEDFLMQSLYLWSHKDFKCSYYCWGYLPSGWSDTFVLAPRACAHYLKSFQFKFFIVYIWLINIHPCSIRFHANCWCVSLSRC